MLKKIINLLLLIFSLNIYSKELIQELDQELLQERFISAVDQGETSTIAQILSSDIILPRKLIGNALLFAANNYKTKNYKEIFELLENRADRHAHRDAYIILNQNNNLINFSSLN